MVNQYRPTTSIITILIFLLLVLPEVGFAVSKSISRTDYQIFTQAKQALEAQRPDTGIKLLRKYFQTHQLRHPFAYELYGHLLLLTNKSVLAIEIYQQGIAEHPDHLSLLQNLAAAYVRNNQLYKAGQTYQQAYDLGGKNSSELAFSAAVMYEKSAKYQQSILLLQQLLQMLDTQPNWLLLLARCYLHQNNTEAALGVLLSASQKFPFNDKIWRSLALCYQRVGKSEHALASYQIANIVNNGVELGRAQLGTKFLNLGAPNLGAQWQMYEADGFQDLIINQFCQTGNLNEALTRAVALQSIQPTALRKFSIGNLLQRMGQVDAAEKVYCELVDAGGLLQAKSLWSLVLLYWSTTQWDKVSLTLQQLELVDESMYQRSAKLRNIIEKIVVVAQ